MPPDLGFHLDASISRRIFFFFRFAERQRGLNFHVALFVCFVLFFCVTV